MADTDPSSKLDRLFQFPCGQTGTHSSHGQGPLAKGKLGRLGDHGTVHTPAERYGTTVQSLE